MARFVVDAQLPPGLADRLKTIGHFAWHVNEIGLEAATDQQIATETASRGSILISKDEDFFVYLS